MIPRPCAGGDAAGLQGCPRGLVRGLPLAWCEHKAEQFMDLRLAKAAQGRKPWRRFSRC